ICCDASGGDRSRCIARIVDGKFSVDAFGEYRDAARAEGDDRFREITSARSQVAARIPQRRQLWGSLSTRRWRDDEDLECRSGRNAGTTDGRMGLRATLKRVNR